MPIGDHISKRKVILMLPISLPMGKDIVIETCTSFSYTEGEPGATPVITWLVLDLPFSVAI